ncbi:hypothetical protein JZ751_014547, partial [Albula glossodonta]
MSGTQETALPSWHSPRSGIPLVHCALQFRHRGHYCLQGTSPSLDPPTHPPGLSAAAPCTQTPSICRVTRAEEGRRDEQQRGSKGALAT